MSFSILYPEQGDVNSHLCNIAVYVDSFLKGIEVRSLRIDPNRLTSVAAALLRPDFPHVDGLDKASPFKKAANFFTWFVAERPIVDPLPPAIVGEKLNSIQNHQNVILAYQVSVHCLHEAQIYKRNEEGHEEVVKLSNRIKVSKHFFCDFVEAFSAAMPHDHFHGVSLLFEQLAYKANPNCSYPEVV